MTIRHDYHTQSPIPYGVLHFSTSRNWTPPVSGQLCLVPRVSAYGSFDCTSTGHRISRIERNQKVFQANKTIRVRGNSAEREDISGIIIVITTQLIYCVPVLSDCIQFKMAPNIALPLNNKGYAHDYDHYRYHYDPWVANGNQALACISGYTSSSSSVLFKHAIVGIPESIHAYTMHVGKSGTLSKGQGR